MSYLCRIYDTANADSLIPNLEYIDVENGYAWLCIPNPAFTLGQVIKRKAYYRAIRPDGKGSKFKYESQACYWLYEMWLASKRSLGR